MTIVHQRTMSTTPSLLAFGLQNHDWVRHTPSDFVPPASPGQRHRRVSTYTPVVYWRTVEGLVKRGRRPWLLLFRALIFAFTTPRTTFPVFLPLLCRAVLRGQELLRLQVSISPEPHPRVHTHFLPFHPRSANPTPRTSSQRQDNV